MYFGYESKSKGIKNVEEWIFFFGIIAGLF